MRSSHLSISLQGRESPKWLQDTFKDAQAVGTPKKDVRERKAPQRFCSYLALVSSISESEPSSYEQAAGQQAWRDAMLEDASIMKNDVWEVVPRPEGKSV
jgi:hypothetical protein